MCAELREFWKDFLHVRAAAQTSQQSHAERSFQHLHEDVYQILVLLRNMQMQPRTILPVRMASTLDEWMETKWPDNPNNQDAIYPSRREFDTGKVHFSNSLVTQVLNTIEQHQYARIVGNSAAGKSVLGAYIAYDWTLRTGSTVYWLDLAEYDDVPDLIYADINSFLDNSDVQLLVIDNTHINPAIVQHAVKQLKRARDNGFSHHRLLLISRPDTTSTPPHQAGIATQLRSQSIYINPDGEVVPCRSRASTCAP